MTKPERISKNIYVALIATGQEKRKSLKNAATYGVNEP